VNYQLHLDRTRLRSIRKSQLPDGLFLQVCDYTRLRSVRKSQHQCVVVLGIIIKKDNLSNKVGRLNKKMGFYLEGVWLWRIRGVLCIWWSPRTLHARTHEGGFLIDIIISNHNNRDTDRKKKSLHSRRREMLEISFPLLIIW